VADEVLRLRQVSVVRDGATLLSEIDWVIRDGERWAVLGPNGAGKTTLLQVAASRLFPTRGTVEVLGSRLGRVDVFELRPRIGLTSAAVADTLPPAERVIDIVMTASWAVVGRGREDYEDVDEARALELLGQLGCRALAPRRFGTLSEGERKRVQIARALMTDPELLLLDEPAAGLDLGAREALLRRLTRIITGPAAPGVVLVSHHVEEIPTGMTHALLLRGGRVVQAGPAASTLTGPALSACFGVPLEVNRQDGRYAARMALAGRHRRVIQPA
jgi:iron complex transport system ATP-binding protein